MKKTLLCLALVLASVALVISCSQETTTPDGVSGVAYVRFGETTRGLTATYEIEDYDDLYWFYKATKTDGAGNTGEKTGWTPVVLSEKMPSKGLSGRIGPFSAGTWKFQLIAFKASGTSAPSSGSSDTDYVSYPYDSPTNYYSDVVYESSETGGQTVELVNGQTKAIEAGVKAKSTTNTGSLKFDSAYFKWASTDTDTTHSDYTPRVAISLDKDTSGGAPAMTYVFSTDTTGDNVADLTLGAYDSTSGYAITLSDNSESGLRVADGVLSGLEEGYYNGTVYGYISATDDSTQFLQDTFTLRIYGSTMTILSGDITEPAEAYLVFGTRYAIAYVDSDGSELSIDGEYATSYLRFSAEDIVKYGASGKVSQNEWIKNEAVELPTVTKEGSTFKGWKINNLEGGDVLTELPATQTGNVTLYAVWETT